jgi:hypothetical protein
VTVKILMTLEGAQKVNAIFNRLPDDLRVHVRQAIGETTRAVERGAKARVPVSGGGRASRKAKSRPGPGELRDTIRSSVHEDASGIVGFVNAGFGKLPRRLKGKNTRTEKVRKARRRKKMGPVTREDAKLGAYAMVVEYGSPRQKKAAKPYLRPALATEKPRHQQRMVKAIQRATAEAEQKAGSVA